MAKKKDIRSVGIEEIEREKESQRTPEEAFKGIGYGIE